jgi:hypothetical protein
LLKKSGRKLRPRTTAEKLLMAEMSTQLYAKMKKEGWNKKKAARELGVCLASLYNYLNQNDLASYDIFKKTHDAWKFQFKHLDFGAKQRATPALQEEYARQYVLPFIESVRENDIEVVRAKSVKSDTLQLTINIKFAG